MSITGRTQWTHDMVHTRQAQPLVLTAEAEAMILHVGKVWICQELMSDPNMVVRLRELTGTTCAEYMESPIIQGPEVLSRGPAPLLHTPGRNAAQHYHIGTNSSAPL